MVVDEFLLVIKKRSAADSHEGDTTRFLPRAPIQKQSEAVRMHVAIEVGVDSLRVPRPTHNLQQPLLNVADKVLRRVEKVVSVGIALKGAGRHVGSQVDHVLCGQRLV